MPQQLPVGKSVTLNASQIDATGAAVEHQPDNIEWSLDNESIATLDTNPDGTAKITAHAEGAVTVTVYDETRDLTATDTILITPGETAPPPVRGDFKPGEPTAIAISFGDIVDAEEDDDDGEDDETLEEEDEQGDGEPGEDRQSEPTQL